MSGIFGRDKCAANLVMAMCLWCTADSLAVNHPNCPFSFPSCQRLATVSSRQCPRHKPKRCLVIQTTEPQKPQKCPKSRFRHPGGVITHEMFFDAFWSQFRVFVVAYTLARPSVHTCIAIFQTFGALGLPMCHIFQVSGSSLPVPIFIGRRIDHINLQAEVKESGTQVFPHMVGHEWQRWIFGNYIQSV